MVEVVPQDMRNVHAFDSSCFVDHGKESSDGQSRLGHQGFRTDWKGKGEIYLYDLFKQIAKTFKQCADIYLHVIVWTDINVPICSLALASKKHLLSWIICCTYYSQSYP